MKLKFRSTCTINYTKELPLAQVNKELRCFSDIILFPRESSLNETMMEPLSRIDVIAIFCVK